jgi:hypothetical protein
MAAFFLYSLLRMPLYNHNFRIILERQDGVTDPLDLLWRQKRYAANRS